MLNFFNPQSIALVGASRKNEKIGGLIFDNLKTFKGKVYPVNPKYDRIDKIKCYDSILDIKKSVDLCIIAIPAKFVPDTLKDCAKKSIKNIIIISAGFKESGEAGADLEEEIKTIAQKYNLQIIGPNCLGLINSQINLNASFAKNNFGKGAISLVMQSGAVTTALFDLSTDKNLGFNKVITIGNKTILDETDFLKYLKNDKSTKIIGLYLENVKRGKEFFKTLKSVSKTKPVLIVKAGNSKAAVSAISSHTGAMASDSFITKTAITDAGAIYCHDILDFVTNLKIFTHFQKPQNNKIVIVTNAGGPGVITTDLISEDKNLELYKFTEKQQKFLSQLLPEAASVKNPIDLLGDAKSDRYTNILKELQNYKDIGAVLNLITAQAGTDIKNIANTILKANHKSSFPIVPVFIGEHSHNLAMQIFKGKNITNCLYPSNAVSALSNYFAFSQNKSNNIEETNINTNRQDKSLTIFKNSKTKSKQALLFEEATTIAKLYRLNILEAQSVNNLKSTEPQFPVILKVDNNKILHKNKVGGVIKNISSEGDYNQAIKSLKSKFKKSNIITQPQIAPGLEFIIGAKRDPNFGPVILFGLGGITTEILDTKLLWLLPTNKESIKRKIEESILNKLLKKEKIKLNQVINEIYKVAELITENDWLKELDLNPIFFYPDKPPTIVDIKLLVK